MINAVSIGEEPTLLVEFGTGDIEISGFELDDNGNGYLGLHELETPRPIGDIKAGDGSTLQDIAPTILFSFTDPRSIDTLIDMLDRCRTKMRCISPEPNKMTLWYIWSEGFAATGQSGSATLHGTRMGETFEEACQALFKDDKTYSKEKNTLWGCHLFDNESDARKSFG